MSTNEISSPSCSIIQITGVNKVFKTSAGDFQALKNVNLCFGQGEYASIMGKSGSGKSTLINMMTGIDHPSSGMVQVAGVEVHNLKESALADWRGRNLGIVFQFFQLLPMLSVLENTMLPMDFCNQYTPSERPTRALQLLELVGLQDAADKLPPALSGGQQQMAAIARALANDPPLIVADEPTGNLDSRTAARILELFDGLVAQGKTVIIVTHDSALAARAGRRVLISDGQVIDEQVAQALDPLPHSVLLKISQLAVGRQVQPGELLFTAQSPTPPRSDPKGGAGLYIVSAGCLEVFHTSRDGRQHVLETLTPGHYFSALEAAACPIPAVNLRVAPAGPASLLWLSPETLGRLLEESHSVEITLTSQAEERAAGYRERYRERYLKR